MVQAEAADWVETRLTGQPRNGVTRVLMHSISWQYFPEASQDRIGAAMAGAGANASPDTPLAWLRLEQRLRAFEAPLDPLAADTSGDDDTDDDDEADDDGGEFKEADKDNFSNVD